LMGTTGILSINGHLYKNLRYDAARDFVPVSYTSLITNILVVPTELPVRTVADLVALAKKRPGSLSFASSGAGSSTHLSGELFKAMAGLYVVHIPYRGSAQALTDVVAGQVSMLFDNAPSAMGFVQQGKLRALAVTGPKRLAALPGVPTMNEAGIRGYESLSWSGIMAPTGTPAPIVTKLNEAIERILRSEDMQRRFATLGMEAVGGPPEVFAKHVKAENLKWGKVVRDAKINID
jgi:tripartite-type tricarboxylate transporter receptor subunit TctC